MKKPKVALIAVVFVLFIVVGIFSHKEIKAQKETHKRDNKILIKQLIKKQKEATLAGVERAKWEGRSHRYKSKYEATLKELEEEKAISVKTSREILEKQKQIYELQKKGAVNVSRGEKRSDIRFSNPAREDRGIYIGEFEATAYNGAEFGGGGNKTASGTTVGKGTVAVDRQVIPLGTRLYVEGYGEGTALDTGESIIGMKIDLWMDSVKKCNQFGRRRVKVWRR